MCTYTSYTPTVAHGCDDTCVYIYDQMCVCECLTRNGAHSPVGKDSEQRACEDSVKV